MKRWEYGESISWGAYHYSGQPATNWYAFANVIFDQANKLGMVVNKPEVHPITTSEYPTPANRPLNTVLDCHKISEKFGITQPDWRIGLKHVLMAWKSSEILNINFLVFIGIDINDRKVISGGLSNVLKSSRTQYFFIILNYYFGSNAVCMIISKRQSNIPQGRECKIFYLNISGRDNLAELCSGIE